MRLQFGGTAVGRALLAASLAVMTAGAVTLVAAPGSAQPAVMQPSGPTVIEPAGSAEAPSSVTVPAVELPPVPVPVPEPVPAAPVSAAGAEPVAAAEPPQPADVVREVGSWFAHGYTLDLRPDGTGTFAVWLGALAGDRIQLRLIPAPGTATVAEVTVIETIGQGALGQESRPGTGGLVTISFGDAVRTAHVEWTAGPDRHSADLCPTEGLDAGAMEALRCGA